MPDTIPECLFMPMREYIPGMGTTAPIFVLEAVSSTFDAAWALAETAKLPAWASVVAFSQTNGRGQLRRKWQSPAGNLYVSFFLPESIARAGDLAAMAMGWCVCESLAGENIQTRLKWPNDFLYIDARQQEGKFGGLLLEERNGRLLAGLGLNLVSAPEKSSLRQGHAVPAVALQSFTEKPHVFWGRMLPVIQAVYEENIAASGLEDIRKKVESRLAWIGRNVYAEDAGVSGRILGVDSDGSLRLEREGAVISVMWLLP
jgi:BirA family biotin operon repressor/biotin-[acetyl-CoA-carboxylase] ligase